MSSLVSRVLVVVFAVSITVVVIFLIGLLTAQEERQAAREDRLRSDFYAISQELEIVKKTLQQNMERRDLLMAELGGEDISTEEAISEITRLKESKDAAESDLGMLREEYALVKAELGGEDISAEEAISEITRLKASKDEAERDLATTRTEYATLKLALEGKHISFADEIVEIARNSIDYSLEARNWHNIESTIIHELVFFAELRIRYGRNRGELGNEFRQNIRAALRDTLVLDSTRTRLQVGRLLDFLYSGERSEEIRRFMENALVSNRDDLASWCEEIGACDGPLQVELLNAQAMFAVAWLIEWKSRGWDSACPYIWPYCVEY